MSILSNLCPFMCAFFLSYPHSLTVSHLFQMNVPSTSTRGYAKYQIRSSGMPRVLANESDVFTLDDVDVDEETDELKPNRCF